MMIDAGPESRAQCMESVDSKVWRFTIFFELASLEANEIFQFSSAKKLKTLRALISIRNILQKKLNERRKVQRYKAKLVVHSSRQSPEIDFDKFSAPLISLGAVRLTLGVHRSPMTTKHLDVMTTFLESKVKEEIYVTVLKGVVLLEGRLKVVSGSQVSTRRLKSFYGLKQRSLN